MNKYPIDFVMTWVDGSNEEWNKEKNKYKKDATLKSDTRKRRFRDWDNLQYFFRGIEKYANWVNHIYLVTPGYYPKWLNINNKRITVVDQNSIIPKECIPTFNNCLIELFFHNIPNLSENFVYFNDDMFIVKQTKEDDFFLNDVPCDTAAISALPAEYSKDGKSVYGIDVMNTRLVAKNFLKKDILSNCKGKLYDIRNGRELIKTILMTPYKNITGFNMIHMPSSYKKETYKKVWKVAYEDLQQTCNSRFRTEFNNSHWCIRNWQICEGNFKVRRNKGFGKFFDVEKAGDENEIINYIQKGKCKIICINDNVESDNDFDIISNKINIALKNKFNKKSEFEI